MSRSNSGTNAPIKNLMKLVHLYCSKSTAEIPAFYIFAQTARNMEGQRLNPAETHISMTSALTSAHALMHFLGLIELRPNMVQYSSQVFSLWKKSTASPDKYDVCRRSTSLSRKFIISQTADLNISLTVTNTQFPNSRSSLYNSELNWVYEPCYCLNHINKTYIVSVRLLLYKCRTAGSE